jgi:two-component system, OmpR family, phosphate regulon sensor histidine kinase PhoR
MHLQNRIALILTLSLMFLGFLSGLFLIQLDIVEVKNYFILSIGLIIFLIIIFFFVSGFISRKMASDLDLITTTVKKIREGNVYEKISLKSIHEIDNLVNEVNRLTEKIEGEFKNISKLEKIRSEFLGNVSHELRTPIFSIQGYLETLLDGAINDPSVNIDFLQKIQKHSERLNNLLGDLIEISKIESGELKLSYRFFDIPEFIDSIVDEMVPVAAQKKIDLRFEYSQKKSISVYADRDRIRQVMINLIDNAIKYNKANGSIEVSLENDKEKVIISVKDTGLGISAEHLPRIFERFYRVDKTRSREIGGTGLGLAIVKHIIEAHKGEIKVESRIGEGSKFSFALSKQVNIK